MIAKEQARKDFVTSQVISRGEPAIDGRDVAEWLSEGTREEVEAFLADVRAQALERCADRALVEERMAEFSREAMELQERHDAEGEAEERLREEEARRRLGGESREVAFRNVLKAALLVTAAGVVPEYLSRYAQTRAMEMNLDMSAAEVLGVCRRDAEAERSSRTVMDVFRSRPEWYGVQMEDASGAVLTTADRRSVLLVDKAAGRALEVDLATKEARAVYDAEGRRRPLMEDERMNPLRSFVAVSPMAEAYLSQNSLKDVALCLDREHQVSPDGEFLVLRNAGTDEYAVALARPLGEMEAGHVLMDYLMDPPSLTVGVEGDMHMSCRGVADEYGLRFDPASEAFEMETRHTTELRFHGRPTVAELMLQSDNNDEESISQRLGYLKVASQGQAVKPETLQNEKKKLTRDLFTVQHIEAREDDVQVSVKASLHM